MACSRANYLVVFETDSQVYGASTIEVALAHEPPEGTTIEQKHVFFLTFQPDTGELVLHEVPRDQVLNPPPPKPKKTKQKVAEDEEA